MRKLIILAFFAAGLQWAVAQNTGYYSDNTNIIGDKTGIIRDNNIAYYEVGNVGYFAYIPSFTIPAPVTPTPYNRVKIPDKWFVRDFRVVNGVVYFCGYNIDNNTALLGHFSVAGLVSGTGVVFYSDQNTAGQLAVLNRIAVKSDKSTVSVMAIGNEVMPGDMETSGSDRVLYIDNYAAATGCIFASNDFREVFWDVVSTDNYFVVTGTGGNNTNELTMRRVQFGIPASGFLPLFGNRYTYFCAHNFSGGVRVAALDGDTIAAAVHYSYDTVEYSTISHKIGYQVSTIDVTSAQMLYNQWSKTGTTDNVAFTTPRDMVYLKDSVALMMIDTFPYLYERGVVRLNPYPSANYSPQYYFYDITYSITVFIYPDGTRDTTITYPKGEPMQYYSLAVLSSRACVAAAGASWMVLNFSTTPEPRFANSCVGSYITDIFVCPRNEPALEVFGETIPYNMRFAVETGNIQTFFYGYCQ